jgi:hypothetical protein
MAMTKRAESEDLRNDNDTITNASRKRDKYDRDK